MKSLSFNLFGLVLKIRETLSPLILMGLIVEIVTEISEVDSEVFDLLDEKVDLTGTTGHLLEVGAEEAQELLLQLGNILEVLE